MYYDKKDRKIKIKAALVSIWVIALISSVLYGYNFFTQNVGYMPEQPIVFSHETHSGKFGIKCLACHFSAEISDNSSVPAVKTCMSCHVGLTTQPDKTAILLSKYDENKPILWERVYRLPDFVRFSHTRHIRAMIDCAVCHGEVETMAKVFQVRNLSMKWCVDCHISPEKFNISPRLISGIYLDTNRLRVDLVDFFEKNRFDNLNYTYYSKYVLSIKPPAPAKFSNKGPIHCSSCHF